jgi:hypothetical protein
MHLSLEKWLLLAVVIVFGGIWVWVLDLRP